MEPASTIRQQGVWTLPAEFAWYGFALEPLCKVLIIQSRSQYMFIGL